MLKSSLLNKEARQKERESSYEHKAFVSGNASNRGRSHIRGPQYNRNNSKGRSKSSNGKMFKDFTCHYFGGPNHYERDCRKKKWDQKSSTTDNKKMILQQPHVMVILSLFVMMLVPDQHANKPIGLLTREPRIILPRIGRCLHHMLVVTLVESKWPTKVWQRLLAYGM